MRQLIEDYIKSIKQVKSKCFWVSPYGQVLYTKYWKHDETMYEMLESKVFNNKYSFSDIENAGWVRVSYSPRTNPQEFMISSLKYINDIQVSKICEQLKDYIDIINDKWLGFTDQRCLFL